MNDYSIVRIGNEYVVRAGEKSVFIVASRRRAARLVTDAAELLDSQAAAQPSPPLEETGPSIVPDPGVTFDAGGTPDPQGIADPSKVP